MIDKTPQKINEMFDEISPKYDLMNNVMSFGLHKIIKKICIKSLEIKPNSEIIDLCCGTGDLGLQLVKNKNVNKVYGLDFSEKMLNKIPNDKIQLVKADCTDIPFEDSSFEGCTFGFGLRNIEDYQQAIKEIHRILKPDGFFAHIEIYGTKYRVNKLFDLYVMFMAKVFGASMDSYKYLLESKNTFLSPDELKKCIEEQGFRQIKSKSFAFGIINFQVFRKIC